MRLKTLTLAARQSDLARIQAYAVGDALKRAYPALEIRYVFRESLGDLNQHDPLWQMPERGVFTEDFHAGLLKGDWDAVVHSWKDLPVQDRNGTYIAATLPRADARDLLVMPRAAAEKVKRGRKLRVLSSSPRRQYNLSPLLPDLLPIPGLALEFLPVRGNVPTRLKKLFRGEGDVLIVAKAALDRLLAAEREEFAATRLELRALLDDAYWMVLPLSRNPTAAAQGALAVEIARARGDVAELLQAIHDPATFAHVAAEREILASYGGGCHQKIGVSCFASEHGKIVSLRGLTDAGEALARFGFEHAEPLPPCAPRAAYPRTDGEAEFFLRRPLTVPPNTGAPLFIAKAEALPEAWNVAWGQPVWTAGLASWRKLARRGIWVNGCCDGLGESPPVLDEIAGRRLEWTKLTHATGEGAIGSGEVLATYELFSADDVPDLSDRTHFYWASGSQFREAIRRFPWIAQGVHSCGPGHTYRQIRAALGNAAKIHVRLSRADWQKEVRA